MQPAKNCETRMATYIFSLAIKIIKGQCELFPDFQFLKQRKESERMCKSSKKITTPCKNKVFAFLKYDRQIDRQNNTLDAHMS